MEPKASVLIITYNQEDSIGRAIESVLAQDCPYSYEIVIGDDASTDGTRAICEDYSRRYPGIIRLMPEAPNKGLVDNYFGCLAAARGEYVADCAGDDEWGDPRRLVRQVEHLDSHPDDVAVISDWSIIRGAEEANVRDIAGYKPYLRHNNGREFMIRTLGCMGHFPLLSAMLYRREALVRILRDNPRQVKRREWGCEDLPVIAALGSEGDIGYLPLKASKYMVGDSTASNSDNAAHLFDFYVKAANCVMDLSSIYGVDQHMISAGLRARVNYLATLALRADDPVRCEKFQQLCDRMYGILGFKGRLYRRSMSRPLARRLLRIIKRLR